MDEKLRRTDIEAERINVPARPDFYWRYRLHVTLEQLLSAEAFNAHLSALLRENGR